MTIRLTLCERDATDILITILRTHPGAEVIVWWTDRQTHIRIAMWDEQLWIGVSWIIFGKCLSDHLTERGTYSSLVSEVAPVMESAHCRTIYTASTSMTQNGPRLYRR